MQFHVSLMLSVRLRATQPKKFLKKSLFRRLRIRLPGSSLDGLASLLQWSIRQSLKWSHKRCARLSSSTLKSFTILSKWLSPIWRLIWWAQMRLKLLHSISSSNSFSSRSMRIWAHGPKLLIALSIQSIERAIGFSSSTIHIKRGARKLNRE